MTLLLIPFIFWKLAKYAEYNEFIDFCEFFSSMNTPLNRKIVKIAATIDIAITLLYIVTLPINLFT